MKKIVTLTALLCTVGISMCIAQTPKTTKGLKDYYDKYFYMGVAVAPQNLNGPQADLILNQFNSLTPENAMKVGPIHPRENEYNWRDADSIVNFAQHHGLRVRGHNLCWHQQNPDWWFKDSTGKQATKELLYKRLHDHIFAVMKRYQGKIYAWDVVNEAIDDNPDNFLRNSLWYQICGDEFITKAFEYAHEADPKAILFYNEYNTERPEKMERTYKLMKKLVDAKVPVQAIGLQAHWSIYEPSAAELRTTIQKFASLGLKVQITELDISIFPWEKERRALRPGETFEYTPELQQKQIDKYKEVFAVLRENKKYVTGVTFWNISDQYTWLDQYPVRGRKNHPLLFDEKLQPKKVFYEVVNFKK